MLERGLKHSKIREFFQDNMKRRMKEQEAQLLAPKSQTGVLSSLLHGLSVAPTQLSERSVR